MNRRRYLLVGCMLIMGLGGVWPCAASSAAGLHRFGGGIHYWYSLEDIVLEGVKEDGVAGLVSYQYMMGELFTVEAALELLGEGYAGADAMVLAPQAYVLVGRAIYAGAGIGINYSDGEMADAPFFALRTGLDLEILPSIYLDLNLNYRFEQWDFARIEDEVTLNTITAGGTIRIELGR
ncbi:hypothetical protein GF339_19780 [candidate division KSB3 bacterium]|uniref:Outer membrane protein beta-barrel domain-containing protein n=1 Tax=candidate division KSB3 bacterium TaxID=2044937 RepID=A0A9D5Q7F1_9BACT|nr:hypothetical protein [candidate division KSB3 bacterium]MBD3326834.1 hypothetical protein [candidate division KSB3 bacterium]